MAEGYFKSQTRSVKIIGLVRQYAKRKQYAVEAALIIVSPENVIRHLQKHKTDKRACSRVEEREQCKYGMYYVHYLC